MKRSNLELRLYKVLAVSSCLVANSWMRVTENSPPIPVLLSAAALLFLLIITNPFSESPFLVSVFSPMMFLILLISSANSFEENRYKFLEWTIALMLLPALKNTSTMVPWFTPVNFVFLNATSLAISSQALNNSYFYSVASTFFVWPQSGWVVEWGFPRFKGGLGDYELLAEVMVLGITSVLFLALDRGWKLKYILSALVMMMTLLQTGTRSSILILVSVAAVIFAGGSNALKRMVIPLLFLLVIIQYLIFNVATTFFSRLREVNFFEGDLSSTINRKQVWSIYQSRLNSEISIFGNGPEFPFEKFGVYPHSMVNSVLYLFGWLGLFILASFILLTLLKVIRRTGGTRSFEITFLSIFLIDQLKIEFTRLGNYVIFVLLCIGLIYQVGVPSDDERQ